MNLLESSRKFIRKNTVASIGTDGLIGNKIIILSSASGPADIVKNGDVIPSQTPFDTDAGLRSLEDTGAEIAIIAKNIKEISERVKNSDLVWDLLADSMMGAELKATFLYLNQIGANGAELTKDMRVIAKDMRSGNGNLAVLLNDSTLSGVSKDLRKIMDEIKAGKGTLGALISDEKAADDVQKTLANIKMLSDSLAYVSSELVSFSKAASAGMGSLNNSVSDTSFVRNLNQTMQHISNSSLKLEENLEGLKHSFLLRRYFRKLEKKKEKEDKKDDK
jgi:phospholipid/cholesterol/gamma-HCH transport system substrate-binding protein